MKITEAQLRKLVQEQQMTLNQTGVDAVLNMAKQIEPMFQILRKTAGANGAVANSPLFLELENTLLELPYQLEEIADLMETQGVEGGLR
mgnify:CR=1 FL=1|jgi:hypothetical protein